MRRFLFTLKKQNPDCLENNQNNQIIYDYEDELEFIEIEEELERLEQEKFYIE